MWDPSFVVGYVFLFALQTNQTIFSDLKAGLPVKKLDALQERTGLIVIALSRDILRLDPRDQFAITRAHSTTQEAVEEILPSLTSELLLYPPSVLKLARLQRIILCSQLQSGLPKAVERAAGIACTHQQTLFLDIGTIGYSDWNLRRNLHHEIYHFIDARQFQRGKDPEWASMNEAGFTYASRYEDLSIAERLRKGFATTYAQFNETEDKAETYSMMISSPLMMARQAEKDPILKRKMQCIKDRLAVFSPSMNASFWEPIEKRPHPQPATPKPEAQKLNQKKVNSREDPGV